MTMQEYCLHVKAFELEEIDRVYHIHLQAFQNMRAGGQKKAGRGKTKPAYTRFRQFFDYKKAVSEVLHKEKKHSRLLEKYTRREGV